MEETSGMVNGRTRRTPKEKFKEVRRFEEKGLKQDQREVREKEVLRTTKKGCALKWSVALNGLFGQFAYKLYVKEGARGTKNGRVAGPYNHAESATAQGTRPGHLHRVCLFMGSL